MEIENLIVYVVRDGYEIKTWLCVKPDIKNDEIIKEAREEFERVGVKLEEDDIFDWQWF